MEVNTTENKTLEQDYRDLAGLLSNIVDSLPIYFFVKDTGDNFRYVYSSPLMNQLYGRYHNDVVGKTDFDLFLDPVVAQSFRDMDEEVVKTGKMQRFVEQMIDPKGILRTMDTMKLLAPREDKPPYLVGISWDITKQRQVEEELHSYNKRLALACQAGKIYPWLWDLVNGTAELSLEENGQIKHVQITHASFTEKIHPDYRKVYENITDRCDVEKWKALFEADDFLSLEEEENCTTYLLRFLMEHYKLPTAIWKLLDEKIHIVQNAGAFRERFPAQFVSYMVHKCESGEEVDFSEFRGAEDADYDQFLQYYDRAYQALQEKKLQEAEQMIGCGDALGITHPVMEICRASLYEGKGQTAEAITLLKKLSAKYPEDDLIAYNTAEILWRNEGRVEASAIYESLREKLPKHYMANLRLTDWYYEQGNYKEAKKCAEEILSVGGDDTFLETLQKINTELEREMKREYAQNHDPGLGLDLGWCYLQDGRTDLGIRTVRELEAKVPADRCEEYLGLMTKLLAEAAEYEKAISTAAKWEESLEKKILRDTDAEEEEKDRDRIRQSHMIRMQCYRAYGYVQPEKFAEAIAEAEKAETGTPKDIGMLIEKAQIYVEMEEYERCAEISQKLIGDYQVYAAYANELEAAKRQWNAAGGIQNGRACLNYFPTYVKAYEMMAKVYMDLTHPEELKELYRQIFIPITENLEGSGGLL